MNDWGVLGLEGDPTPGDPGRTRDLASRLLGAAELAEGNTARLRSVAAAGGELRMQGNYAAKFRQVLDGLPEELAKLGRAYRGAGEAITAFASGLEVAKTEAGSALRAGRDAEAVFQGAVRKVQALLPPGRAATVVVGRHLDESLVEVALADLDEGIKIEARAAMRRARFAAQDRDRAARLATEAARLREEAESRCVQGIHAALDGSGIENRSWLTKAWDTVTAPFRSWDAFVQRCAGVAAVVAAVLLLLVAPLTLLAAALVTGTVVGAAELADTLDRYAQGTVGLADVGWAALGLLPGAAVVVGVVTLGRVVADQAQRVRDCVGRLVHPVLAGRREADGTPTSATVSPALQDLRDRAGALPGGNLTWDTEDYLRWKVGLGEPEKEFKLRWIRDNREVIKAAADHYGIPVDVLAGIAYIEIGGKPMVLDDGADLVRRGLPDWTRDGTPFEGEPNQTSYGPLAVQVRRAAEALGYDPNNLSAQQRNELIASLENPKECVFVAARHLSDLKQSSDFALTDPGHMTAEQGRELVARYNGGPHWQGHHAQGYANDYVAHLAEAAEALR